MNTHHAIIVADSFRFVVQRLIPRIERLIEHGFDVHVVARNDDAYPLLPKDVFVRKLPASSLAAPIDILLVQSYFIELKPTLVHAFGWSSSIFAALAAQTLDIPGLVVSLYQPDLSPQSDELTNWLPLSLANALENLPLTSLTETSVFEILFDKLFSSVNLFITHAPKDKEWVDQLRGNPSKSRCFCINGDGVGVNVRVPAVSRPTSNECPDATSRRDNSFHIGTLVENAKSYDWLIEILIETLSERFDTHFHIGIFKDNPSIDRFLRIGRYHSVDIHPIDRFSRYESDFFSRCDLYLDLNSQPNTMHIMHAMTASVPVISTPSTTVSYLFREDSDLPLAERLLTTGGTTCPRDEATWKQLLHDLLDHPNDLIRARGKARQNATQLFNQTKIDYEMLRHYDAILGNDTNHSFPLEINDLLNS